MLYDEYYYFLSKQNDKKLFEKILFLARIIIEYRIESLNLEKITYKTIFETIEETTIEEVLSDSSKYYPELRDFDFNCYNLNWETFVKYLEKKFSDFDLERFVYFVYEQAIHLKDMDWLIIYVLETDIWSSKYINSKVNVLKVLEELVLKYPK